MASHEPPSRAASTLTPNDANTVVLADDASAGPATFTKGSAFWLTFIALNVSTFLSALDLTAVSTALPTITADLNGSDDFSWVGSAYALSSTAFLPLSGSLADIFGRRPVMMGSILLFAIGSAISSASQNMHMLIAARSKLYFIVRRRRVLTARSMTSYTRHWRRRNPQPQRGHCLRSCTTG